MWSARALLNRKAKVEKYKKNITVSECGKSKLKHYGFTRDWK